MMLQRILEETMDMISMNKVMYPEEWLSAWIQKISQREKWKARAQYIYHQKFIEEKSLVKSMYF